MSEKIPMGIKHIHLEKKTSTKNEIIDLIMEGLAETISRIYLAGTELPTKESLGLDKIPDISFPKISTCCCFSSEMHPKHKIRDGIAPRKMHTDIHLTYYKEGGQKKNMSFKFEQEF